MAWRPGAAGASSGGGGTLTEVEGFNLSETWNGKGLLYQAADAPGSNAQTLRVMPANRFNPETYVKVTNRAGNYVDMAGNEVLGKADAAHIPLSVFESSNQDPIWQALGRKG